MELVVDANILFAALIKEGITSEILINDSLILYSAEHLFSEFENYENLIIEKTQRTEEDFNRFMTILRRRIKIVPSEEFKEHMPLAKEICPDPDDTFYFALALKLKCAIWSNDKKLKQQTMVKVFSTEEVLKVMSD